MKPSQKKLFAASAFSAMLSLGGCSHPTEKTTESVENVQKHLRSRFCQTIDCMNENDALEKENLQKIIQDFRADTKNLWKAKTLDALMLRDIDLQNTQPMAVTHRYYLMENLRAIDTAFNAFQKTSLTREVNIQIFEIFQNLPSKIHNGEDPIALMETVYALMLSDLKNLEDTGIFTTSTPRDFIEKNISFHNISGEKNTLAFYNGTTFETPEISEFLNLFTIEFLNKKREKNAQLDKEVVLSAEEIRQMVRNVQKKSVLPLSFGVRISLGLSNVEVMLKPFLQESAMPIDLPGVILSSDPKIAKIQENFALEHRTKSEMNAGNITYSVQKSRVNPFLSSPKGHLLSKYETDKAALDAKKSGILVKIPDSTKYYSLDESIKKDPTKSLNSPEVAWEIQQIAKKFFDQTDKELTINSLLRTQEANARLVNASKNSSHMYAGAVDFRIIDLTENEKTILKNILLEMDAAGRGILIEEKNPEHFHWSVTTVHQTLHKKYPNYDKIPENVDQTATLGEYLDTKKIDNGFDYSTKIILQDIFSKAQIDYMKFSAHERRIIQQNLETVLRYIADIESSGGTYVSHKESSAVGPFQFLVGYRDGKRLEKYQTKDGTENFSTFETFLRTYIKYANGVKIPQVDMPMHPQWVSDALNSKGKIGPNELTFEQNINLLLVGTFLGDDKKKAENLMKVIVLGDYDAMEALYAEHHSNPDEKTQKLMRAANQKFSGKLTPVIIL